MTKLSFAVFIAGVGCAGALQAAPCATASLAQYVAMGEMGCTIGSAPTFTFSGFTFTPDNQSSTLQASQITVTPAVGNRGALGLTFSSSGFQATSGQDMEYSIGYLEDPPPPEIIRFTEDLEDPTTAPAFADITTSLCIDPDCPRHASVDVFDKGTTSRLADSVEIQPSTVYVQVSNDIVLNAGAGGSTSITGFDNVTGITGTPEPGTFLLGGVGLLGLLLRRMGAKLL